MRRSADSAEFADLRAIVAESSGRFVIIVI
jgi:hypothetical protein